MQCVAHAVRMHVCTVTPHTLLYEYCICLPKTALVGLDHRHIQASLAQAAAIMPISTTCLLYSLWLRCAGYQATTMAAPPPSGPSPIPGPQGVPNTKVDLALPSILPPAEAALSLTTASVSAAVETAAASVPAVRPRETSVKSKAVPQVCHVFCKHAMVAVCGWAAVMWHTSRLKLCMQLGVSLPPPKQGICSIVPCLAPGGGTS